MAYRNKTYVIFDGDNDIWAYRFMHGWIAREHIDFNFHDAHDLGSELTDRASEETIKRRLRERFSSAKQVIVLIGERTKFLYRFVRWELEVAVDLKLPIIAVNLNDKRICDFELCPPVIRDEFVVHVPFKANAIQLALDNFPDEHANRSPYDHGPRWYGEDVYRQLGILTG
jgi:MTH538 TIR-like domain (DUF1863)